MVLVHHTVSLKDNASFKFPGRVIGRELRVLLGTRGEETTKVTFLTTGLSSCTDLAPFLDLRFIPTSDLAQPRPLLLRRRLGGRSLPNLGFVHGASDERGRRRRH